MLIRRMDLGDIDEIVALEHDLLSSPWNKEAFCYELEKNASSTILILEDSEHILGYLGMWTLGDQSQITTIGIRKEEQGKGYSKVLMAKCEEITRHLGYLNINLEVRISNTKAINLYESCGFKVVATRKNYYQDNHEDAYLMVKEMEE